MKIKSIQYKKSSKVQILQIYLVFFGAHILVAINSIIYSVLKKSRIA